MWIKCTNDATERLKTPYMDEPVKFSGNGTAQVAEDVGEQLIKDLDSIVAYEEDN